MLLHGASQDCTTAVHDKAELSLQSGGGPKQARLCMSGSWGRWPKSDHRQLRDFIRVASPGGARLRMCTDQGQVHPGR